MKTILAAAFNQETNRYCPGVTTMEDFQNNRAFFDTPSVLQTYQGTKSEMTAFEHTFADKADYEVIPVAAAVASPGAVVAQDVWEKVRDTLLTAIENTPAVDGILLALHGAMVTEEFEDGEGELLEVLRGAVGKDVPILATLDLHANITEKMLRYADGLFACEGYPHVDFYETGLRAADCMYKTLEGQIRPVLCGCKLDLILPYMPTEHPVYAPFLAEAKSLWGKGNLIDVSICHGFFPADIYEQGVAILAVANGDAALAQKAADDLGAKMFAARGQLTRECLTPDEAVRQALHSESYPVVLADVADNPGAGASGDGVELLRKLLEYKADKVAVSSIFDPETVEIAEKAGVGSEIEIDLGGKMMPQFTGGPLHCRAYVKAISDGKYRIRDKVYQGRIANMGKTALLQIDGIYVIVNSVRVQTLDLEAYRSVGIQPQDMQILVTKSTIHYRASFSNVASVMLEVEAPALAVQQPTSAPLAHSRRPIYPLDDI